MLLHRLKKKDQVEGAPKNLYLLPELCTMTGLTDEMRQSFQIMKDLGAHTRVPPPGRLKSLRDFRSGMEENAEVQKRLKGWGVRYSQDPVKLNARTVTRESIIAGGNRKVSQSSAQLID